MAEARGAIGIVSIPTPASLKRVPWERRKAYAEEPSLTWVETDGKPYDEAPGIRFSASLSHSAAEGSSPGKCSLAIAPLPFSFVPKYFSRSGQ